MQPFSIPMAVRRLAVLAAVCWLIVAPAAAQEWTRFRGPNGTGRAETVLPAAFASADFNWKVPLPGIGHGSPVVWGDRVFVLSADPKTATRHLVCVDRQGKTLWTRSYPSKPHHLHVRSSYASCTPAVDADRVYVAWSTPEETTLLALSHDGELVWKKDLGPWTSQHGFGTSPIRYQDLLILFNSQQADQLKPDQQPGKSAMLAFDAASGELRWENPRKSTRVCYSVPFVYQGADGKDQLVCSSTADGIFSVDPSTGKPLWNVSGLSMRTVASPIAAGGLIFGSTGSGGGGNYVLAVRPGPTPEKAYEIKRNAPYVPTLVASKEGLMFLWFDKGIVTCVEASTGQEYWKERVSKAFSGSPVLSGDKVYCIDEDGVMFAVAADKKFELLGKTELGEPSRSTPAISGGQMFVRTEGHLISLGGPAS